MEKQSYTWAQTGGAVLGIGAYLLQSNWTQVLADINLWAMTVGFVLSMAKVGIAGLVGGYFGKLGQKMMDNSKWYKKWQSSRSKKR